jgi:hypothetical protein
MGGPLDLAPVPQTPYSLVLSSRDGPKSPGEGQVGADP